MASSGTYTVWMRCGDPQTRWFPQERNLSQDDAQKRMTIGNANARRFATSMVYLALPNGERPANLKALPASPVGQAVKQ